MVAVSHNIVGSALVERARSMVSHTVGAAARYTTIGKLWETLAGRGTISKNISEEYVATMITTVTMVPANAF